MNRLNLVSMLLALPYFHTTIAFLVLKDTTKLQEFDSNKPYIPNPKLGNQTVSPESIVCSSIFPEHIPPYINFSLYSDPKRVLPPEVKKHLIWISSLHMVNQVILKTGLSLKSGRSRDFDPNIDWFGFFNARVSQNREPSAVLKRSYQKYNFLPGAEELCHKDKMWYNIQRLTKKFDKTGHDFDFVQETYAFPGEFFQFFKRMTFWKNNGEDWLYKPVTGAHSVGFFVLNNEGRVKTIPGTQRAIIQRFMNAPYGGRFIRYRLYVLQTSVHPLRLYIYNKGDCILKKTPVSLLDVVIESNELLNTIAKQEGHDPIKLQARMEDAILKTILSALHKMAQKFVSELQHSYNSYQVWSVDFMFDEFGIPWLTEFNRYISLGLLFEEAAAVKVPMITETLNVAGYHFPPTLSTEARRFVRGWISEGKNKNPVIFNEKLYSFNRSARTAAKAEKYSTMFQTAGTNRSYYLESILDDLTPDDLRHLGIAEDELSRTRNYKRIFPTDLTYTYHRFFETSHPYPYMLQDAWENKYGRDRAQGVSVLRNLMRKTRTRRRILHLQPENIKYK